MAENLHIKKGDSFVDGPRSPEKARELLALAEELGIEKHRILTTSGGYIVPSELVKESGRRAKSQAEADAEADADAAVKAQEEADAQAAADAAAAAALFDPSEHDVVTVVAYLDEADEDEKARVIAAEAEGKNRVTITGATSEGAK